MNELQTTGVPGQVVLPGLTAEMGYESTKLDSKREKFCWEYVLGGNYGSRAYRLAYPDCTSRASSEANASRLLKAEKIQKRIVEIQEEIKRRYRCTADDLIDHHSRVLKIDRRHFIGKGGKPVGVEELDPLAASILEVDFERDTRTGAIRAVPVVPTRHQSAVELAKIFGINKEPLQAGVQINISEHDRERDREIEMAKFDVLRERIRQLKNEAEE